MAAVALVMYAGFLAVVLLAPSARMQISVVSTTAQLMTLVLPDSLVSGARVEMGLNALMVVPLVFLATLVFPRVRWQDWTAYGFLGACLVELVQGLVLQGRSATYVDVVANGVGGFLGAAGASLWQRRHAGRKADTPLA